MDMEERESALDNSFDLNPPAALPSMQISHSRVDLR